jgi:hypothetical protein
MDHRYMPWLDYKYLTRKHLSYRQTAKIDETLMIEEASTKMAGDGNRPSTLSSSLGRLAGGLW